MTGRIPVSVIIPTYNRSRLLLEALQSALDQTLSNVEIIVVNDGSTDDTEEVLRPFQDRITYLESAHGGPAQARNVGMRAAKGDYIAFLDSDDIYLPHKLGLQVAFMDAFPEVGLTSTDVTAFNKDGILEEYHLRTYHGIYRARGLSYEDIYASGGEFSWDGLDAPVPYFIGDVFPYVLQGTLIMSNTVLLRREVFEEVGFQNERYKYAQDYEYVVRMCKHFRVGFLNIPTYLFRYHDEQHSMYQGIPQEGGDRSEEVARRKRLISIEGEKVCLQAVLEWGCGDPEFYGENRDWLNRRVAQICYTIGGKWLSLGESRKARESFRKGLSYDPAWRENRQGILVSLCPTLLRPIMLGVLGRIRRGVGVLRKLAGPPGPA